MLDTLTQPNYFGILPAKVRYDDRLSSEAKVFYTEITALTQANGCCTASNGYFSKLYKKSEPTISRWVGELKKAGHISTVKVSQNGLIVGRKIWLKQEVDSHFQLPSEERQKNKIVVNTVCHETEDVCRKVEVNSKLSKDNYCATNVAPHLPNSKINVVEKSADQKDLDQEFLIFWEAYGLKKNKKAAARSWKRLNKEKKAKALAHIPAYKASIPEWKQQMHPATYLNGERWEDDLDQTEGHQAPKVEADIKLTDAWEDSYQRFNQELKNNLGKKHSMLKPLTRSEFKAWMLHERKTCTKNKIGKSLPKTLLSCAKKASTRNDYKFKFEYKTVDLFFSHLINELFAERGWDNFKMSL